MRDIYTVFLSRPMRRVTLKQTDSTSTFRKFSEKSLGRPRFSRAVDIHSCSADSLLEPLRSASLKVIIDLFIQVTFGSQVQKNMVDRDPNRKIHTLTT